MRTAQGEVPHSVLHRVAGWIPVLVGVLLAGSAIALIAIRLDSHVAGRYLLVALPVCLIVLLAFRNRVIAGELSKRVLLVHDRRRRLMAQRSRRTEESEVFYASPEWKLLRNAVIKDQGLLCRGCGAVMASALEVTVGHIRPRVDYPNLALSRDNLQVLCRSCNPTKRNRESD